MTSPSTRGTMRSDRVFCLRLTDLPGGLQTFPRVIAWTDTLYYTRHTSTHDTATHEILAAVYIPRTRAGFDADAPRLMVTR